MTTGQYIGHALRYFFKLILLVALIYALLFVTGYSNVSAGYHLQALFSSTRGILLFVVIGVLSGFYPLYGFISRRVEADIERDQEKIVNAFHSGGLTMTGRDDEGNMIFRSSSPIMKVWKMFDDRVTVQSAGDGAIIISGLRKDVVQAQFRIETYLRNSRENQ